MLVKRRMLVVAALVVLAGCSTAKVQLKTSADDNAAIVVTSSGIASPFEIAGGQTHGIYFSDAQGKHYLKGLPTMQKAEGQSFCATWNVDGRTVTVRVAAEGADYGLSLSADKSEGITGWGIAVGAEPDEYFTGLSARVVDGDQKLSWKQGITATMNLRGQTVDMKLHYTLSQYAPFYLSSRGYGLFTHGTWIGQYTFPPAGKPGVVDVYFEGPSCEFTLYTGGVERVVRRHMMNSGPQVLLPKWAFRPYRWRDDHNHRETYYDGSPVHAPYNSEVVEDVLMMEALDIPCGVYWIDRPWGQNVTSTFGYDDLEYDTERLPNTEKMITWLKDRDIRLLLWICNWACGPNMEREGYENGYVIDTPDTKFRGGNKLNFIDLTNPKAVTWWQSYLEKPLRDGVAGFKMDRAEERSRYLWENNPTVSDGRTGREVFNDYARLYVKAAYGACQNVHGDDFVLLPRAGYTGSAQYAAFWAGDTYGDQWGLRSAIIGGQKASLIGYPFWGSDTGGYSYRKDRSRKNPKTVHPEVGCRWLAFSCFCPIMEVGPTANKGLWDIDDALTATWRMYAILHENLLDYTYQYAKEAHETGMPVMRPLFLAYPDQPESWQDWQTYLYGPDILVSAIWQEGKVLSQSVYLPKGEQWIDAWNPKNVLEGGQTVTVKCPVYKIPIYIRKGSGVDLGDLNKLWTDSVKAVKNRPTMAELEKKAGFSK